MRQKLTPFIFKYKFLPLFIGLTFIIPLLISFLLQGFSVPASIPIFIIINLILAYLFSKRIPIKRSFLMFYAVLLSIGLPFLFFFILLNLPAQKEHDRVMYDICMPALRKYYKVSGNEIFPDEAYNPTDDKGNGKWWYQHLECENNVLSGKEATFSANPVEFKPVSK